MSVVVEEVFAAEMWRPVEDVGALCHVILAYFNATGFRE